MARILVVDDSRTSRRLLMDMLQKAGHTVVGEAVNGQDGFDQYEKLHPDVVTMDITMPVMDGIASLSMIRKHDPKACVVMLTAAGQKDKMMEALKLGAAEFVTKPLSEESVLSALDRVLEHV